MSQAIHVLLIVIHYYKLRDMKQHKIYTKILELLYFCKLACVIILFYSNSNIIL